MAEAIDSFPREQDMASLAQAELDHLHAGPAWIVLKGRVTDATGAGVPGACVFAGEGLFDPPIIAGADGVFLARRRASPDFPYCLVCAEDEQRPLAGIGIAKVGSNNTATIAVELKPLVSVSGRVVDVARHPVAGARIGARAVLEGLPSVDVAYPLLESPALCRAMRGACSPWACSCAG